MIQCRTARPAGVAVSATCSFSAVLAIECAIPGAPPKPVLERDAAEAFATALAHDLGHRIDGVADFDLVTVGALYDQAQLLRPRWPVHAALADACTRLPSGGGRVIAIGAHAGRLPAAALEPDRRLYGSPMLVLPWLLSGPTSRIAEAGRRLEHELLEHGLAGAALAIALAGAFGVEITHARHLTSLDLCALACAQYTHADLGPVWQLIENAVLSPDRALSVALEDGSQLDWDGEAATINGSDARRIAHLRAILAAHGIVLPQA